MNLGNGVACVNVIRQFNFKVDGGGIGVSGIPRIPGLGFLPGKNFRDFGTRAKESRIKIFIQDVGNTLFCTMGMPGIAIIPNFYFRDSGFDTPYHSPFNSHHNMIYSRLYSNQVRRSFSTTTGVSRQGSKYSLSKLIWSKWTTFKFHIQNIINKGGFQISSKNQESESESPQMIYLEVLLLRMNFVYMS